MSQQTGINDPGTIWRDQPREKLAVELEHVVNRRAEALHDSTRSEILASIGAALLLVGIVAWRLAPGYERVVEAGFAAVVVWVAVTLYWFRHWLGREDHAGVAAPGLAYYRRELERRRDHLRNEWLWHGPLLLACLILAGVLAGKWYPGGGRLRTVLPLIAVLALWTASGIRRRLRQARELEREIGEVDELSGPPPGRGPTPQYNID